jgi:hypothetical protein
MSAPDGGRASGNRTGAGREPRYDWSAIRSRFLATRATLPEFSKSEGIPIGRLKKRSAAEKWMDLRAKQDAAVEAGIARQIIKHRIREETEIDGDVHEGATDAIRIAREMLGQCDEPAKLKAVVEALEKAHRLARTSARLTPEPTPKAGGDETDSGELVIRRTDPNGDEVEVSVGGATNDRRPDRLPADADAVAVPSGPDEPR